MAVPTPVQYGQPPTNPLQSFMQGAQVGQQIGGAVQGYQDIQNAAAAQQKAIEDAAAKKREEEAVNAATIRIYDRTATPEDYALAQKVYPADKIKAMNESLAAQTSEQRIANSQESGAIVSALTLKNYDVAKALLKKRADALAASGDDQGAAMFNDMINKVGTDAGDASVNTVLGMGLSMTEEGRKALQSMGKDAQLNTLMAQKEAELAKAQTDSEKAKIELKYQDAEEDLANKKTQAEIDKLKAEADKLKADLETSRNPSLALDTSARTLINAAVDKATAADLAASQASNLASELTAIKPPAGWTSNALEALKKVAGGQDKFTAAKQEYIKMRNTDVLQNLPPGVASDKDIEIAMSAFPADNASPDQIVSFLNGMAKLQRYTASVNKARAEWANQNGSLATSKNGMTIGGKPVPAGTNFWDYTKTIPIPNVAKFSGTAAGGTPEEVDF